MVQGPPVETCPKEREEDAASLRLAFFPWIHEAGLRIYCLLGALDVGIIVL